MTDSDPILDDDLVEYEVSKPPLPIPPTDPSAGTQVSLCFNADWLPYVLGALKQLTARDIWDQSDQDGVTQAVEWANTLIGADAHVCGASTETCRSFDFTIDDGGWEAADGYSVTLFGGLGFAGADPSNLDRVYIKRAFGGTYTLIRVEVTLTDAILGDAAGVICPGSSTPSCSEPYIHVPVPSFFVWTGSVSCSVVCLGCERGDANTASWGEIKNVVLFFSGDAPALGTACA